jgi:exodeoxyribonuclease VII large subunit
VAASEVPTISAVGHETDFTLCDFAADRRAGTPSIAAEMAVPVLSELVARIDALGAQLAVSLRGRGEWFAQRVDHLSERLRPAFRMKFADLESRLSRAGEKLTLLSPFNVLERGYSLVTDASGAVVRDASRLSPGDRLHARFACGSADLSVVAGHRESSST